MQHSKRLSHGNGEGRACTPRSGEAARHGRLQSVTPLMRNVHNRGAQAGDRVSGACDGWCGGSFFWGRWKRSGVKTVVAAAWLRDHTPQKLAVKARFPLEGKNHAFVYKQVLNEANKQSGRRPVSSMLLCVSKEKPEENKALS